MAKYLNLDGLTKFWERLKKFKVYNYVGYKTDKQYYTNIFSIKCSKAQLNKPFVFNIYGRGYSTSKLEVLIASDIDSYKPNLVYCKHIINKFDGNSGVTSNVGYTIEDSETERTYRFWKRDNERYGWSAANVECYGSYAELVTFDGINSETEPEGIVWADIFYDNVSQSDVANWNAKSDVHKTLGGYGITDAAVSRTLTNENLNNVTTPGFYNASGNNGVTNKPSGIDWFGLEVIHDASGSYYTQKLYSDGKSYTRHCRNSTWGYWSEDKLTDTTYSVVSKTSNGLCPQLPNETTTTKYLRQDGTWSVPPNDNTDTKVTQTVKSDNAEYPILLAPASQTTTQTTTACFDSGVKLNPSTDAITAKEYKGKIISINSTGGTNTAAVTTSPYKPNIWKFNASITATDGMLVSITAPSDGHSNGVFLSLNNGTNYYPIVLNGTSGLTTHYPNGSQLLLAFDSDGSASSIYPLNGADTTTTVTGGVWRVINYFDANTNDTRSGLATCSTADGTAAKTATMPNFAQPTNCMILLQVTVANTVASKLTLNVNGQGAKDVKINGTITSSTNYSLPIGYYWAKYDGTYWNLTKLEFTDTTYSVVSKTSNGLCPQLPNETATNKYLRQDGRWVAPPNDTTNDTRSTIGFFNNINADVINVDFINFTLVNGSTVVIYINTECVSNVSLKLNINNTLGYPIKMYDIEQQMFITKSKLAPGFYICTYKYDTNRSYWELVPFTVNNVRNKYENLIPSQKAVSDRFGDVYNDMNIKDFLKDMNKISGESESETIFFGFRGPSIAKVNTTTTGYGDITESPYLVSCYNTGTKTTKGTTYYKDVKASEVTVGNADKVGGMAFKFVTSFPSSYESKTVYILA